VPPDHPDNYVMRAKAIVQRTPGAVLANQFYNQVNPETHYRTTGPELWEQTEGRITHFVAAPGTGGTVSGVGRFLKEKNPKIRIIAGDPEGSIFAEYARTRNVGDGHPYKVEGIGNDKIPETLHFQYIDEFHTVSDAEAFQMARRLVREEGLFVGGSTGLNVTVALRVAREVNDPSACIVALLCDTGERYLSKVFNDEWLQEHQLLPSPRVTAGSLLTGKGREAPPLVTVEAAQTARQALNLMSTYNVSQLPVMAGGECAGAVTEATLMAHAIGDASSLERPVRDQMDPPYPVVDADVPLERFSGMLSRETPAVLVRADGAFVGIVTRYDVLHHMQGLR
jgi:cystathionine beta-synthase